MGSFCHRRARVGWHILEHFRDGEVQTRPDRRKALASIEFVLSAPIVMKGAVGPARAAMRRWLRSALLRGDRSFAGVFGRFRAISNAGYSIVKERVFP